MSHLARRLLRASLVLAGLAAGTGTAAYADPVADPSLVWGGGDVYVKFLSREAAYTDELYLFLAHPSDPSQRVFLFNNQDFANGVDYAGAVGAPWEVKIDAATLAPYYSAGDELIFGVCVNSPDCTTVYYTGANNPTQRTEGNDASGVASTYGSGWYEQTVGFEDLAEGQRDNDYDDVVFAFRTATTVPEPVSMTLLATGLAGMGGVGALRRRRQK